MSTYAELIERACFDVLPSLGDTSIQSLRTKAEAIFPSIVEELVESVAANVQHPWRTFIADVTDPIANGDVIPSTGSGGKVIVGNYGYVRDASDDKLCTETLDFTELQTIITNVNTWNTFPLYSYRIIKPRIYHTRTNVVIDVCVYDPDDVTTAIQADQIPIFPDAVGAYVDALVGKLTVQAMFQGDQYAMLTTK